MAERTSQESSSFLVRLWREPREDGGEGTGPLRCYVRNLKTGEEVYADNPENFARLLALHGVKASAAGLGGEQVVEELGRSQEAASQSRIR
jgi:hypothetical protein